MNQDSILSRPSADQQRRDSESAPQMSVEKKSSDRRRPSATQRFCGKCDDQISGQFVRALENTWHLDCFTCNDCGKIVASKFFPVPDQGPHQYPLCEVDYFRRLDLLCFACGGALRGSYITALDRKYHIEHFTCSVCPTVFGAQDSYYEHDGNVYCHYHYSTKFAQRCNGCKTAILKQFVEIYRQGQNQHWHPECYMIHKYWNVRLHSPDEPVKDHRASIEGDASEEERKRVRVEEERIEAKVLWIWRTLSGYEEKSASCISDMLLHVSNGAYIEGVMSAKKFILHIDLLFQAADELDFTMSKTFGKGLAYSREAKLLCKKVVAFFQLLAKSQETGVRRLGVTQELLSLVTGLAHYLKLLIRICLQGSLKLERETGKEEGLQQFLDCINSLESKLEAEDAPSIAVPDANTYINSTADTCPICERPVEDRCFRHDDKVFHYNCMKCESCQRDLTADSDAARWDSQQQRLSCNRCLPSASESAGKFLAVSRLQQYIHLLRVAHARLLATLRTSGALPHTSDDPNLDQYDSNSGHRTGASAALEPPHLRPETRSRSYGGRSSLDETSTSYEQTLGDIRRLRSTRMDKNVSQTMRKARTSRLIDDPRNQSTARPGSADDDAINGNQKGFRIIQDKESPAEPLSQLNLDSIRLDDIPRLVAAEHAKEQRPNANKYARGGLVPAETQPRLQHRREASGALELEKLGPEGNRPKRFFSELSALEYFIIRHVAVLSMEPLLQGHFNQEELLDLIETRKPTFWGKFGKAFQKTDKKKGGRKGVFGMPLEKLIETDGAECTDCIGPGVVKVPALIQDALSAMRTMDMSMEGVFRKNGNIRRLNETAETIDTKGGDAVDLNSESPVQVAALLKKFLRELPDPVMTFKLHKLFITSQKIQDEDTRRRILHLSCCLLPKVHRDTMEVLFCFLTWAASFSVVDEETGSKMDIHNMATVVAPNILYGNTKTDTMEESFLAIEAVHTLIQCNEAMSEVPEDLQSVLSDSSLFSGSAEITTKEILKRYGNLGKPLSTTTSNTDEASATIHKSKDSRGSAPVVTRVDENPYQVKKGWQMESSVRPVGGNATMQHTPPSGPNGFYAAPPPAVNSRDSFGANGSPHRGGRNHRDGVSGSGGMYSNSMGVT